MSDCSDCCRGGSQMADGLSAMNVRLTAEIVRTIILKIGGDAESIMKAAGAAARAFETLYPIINGANQRRSEHDFDALLSKIVEAARAESGGNGMKHS